MSTPFSAFMSESRTRVDQALRQLFPDESETLTNLTEAMRYSVFNGGKRIRPILAYASATAIAGLKQPLSVDAVACALECMHAYSLVHDDLPAMDDDDLRRGKPTCHIAFDEATAILAGDALQTFAFELLVNVPDVTDTVKLKLIQRLAIASGARGMVLGQAIDLAAVDRQLELANLETMHRHKTGALIRASVAMGAITANANEDQLRALDIYASAIGLAFQVQDDILDVTTDTQTLGKTQGADIQRNKPTYVSLLGLEQARLKARDLHETALAALSTFDENADHLRAISRYIIERTY